MYRLTLMVVALACVQPPSLYASDRVSTAYPSVPGALTADFGTVTIAWQRNIPDPLASRIEAVLTSMFSGTADEHVFSDGMRRALGMLVDNGYRHARLAPRDFTLRNGRLDFVLHVNPGYRSRVVGYELAGLAHTDTVWLRNVVALPLDVPLTGAWLRDAVSRLSRVSYIRVESAPEIVTLDSDPISGNIDVVVRWNLKESRPARFDGFLAAGGNSAHGALTGRASVQFGGLFGRDRSVKVRYQRLQPQWRSLNLRFAEAGALGRAIDWALELDESNQLDHRQSISGNLGYLFNRAKRWRIDLGGRWRKVTPGESQIAPVRMIEASVGLQKQGRDPGWSRKTQSQLALQVTLSRRRQFAASEVDRAETVDDRFRLHGRAIITKPLATRWRVQLSTVGRWWVAGRDRLGPGDEWYLGGADHLRGYEDQTLAATSGIWGALELQRWLGPAMAISLFGEAAKLSDLGWEQASNGIHHPYGYGLALGLRSQDRIGRLEFAWRDKAAWRDGIVRLKISQSW